MLFGPLAFSVSGDDANTDETSDVIADKNGDVTDKSASIRRNAENDYSIGVSTAKSSTKQDANFRAK